MIISSCWICLCCWKFNNLISWSHIVHIPPQVAAKTKGRGRRRMVRHTTSNTGERSGIQRWVIVESARNSCPFLPNCWWSSRPTVFLLLRSGLRPIRTHWCFAWWPGIRLAAWRQAAVCRFNSENKFLFLKLPWLDTWARLGVDCCSSWSISLVGGRPISSTSFCWNLRSLSLLWGKCLKWLRLCQTVHLVRWQQ